MVYIQLERLALLALCYWSVGTIMALGGNGFGSTGAHSYISTNFSTAFRLRNCLFFLSFIFSLSVSIVFLFFLCQFPWYFSAYFRFSPQSHSLSNTPTPPLCSRQEGKTILFCSRPFVRLFRVVGLRKKNGLFCGLKDFALIDVLVSWKL